MSVFSTVHSILDFFQFMLILTHCIFPIFSAKPRGPLDVVHYRDVPGLDDALITTYQKYTILAKILKSTYY